MNMAEATKKFEAMFGDVQTGLPQRYSQTSEEYIEFGNDGPRVEGQVTIVVSDFLTGKRVPGCTIHLTEYSAIAQWLENVTEFATALSPEKKTLYWRVRPESGFHQVDINAANWLYRMPTWAIYSRFLISDKPRIA